MKFVIQLLATASIASASAAAQDTPPSRSPHTDTSEEIIITGDYVRGLDILSGASVLSGDELIRDLRPQIGDTLTRLPGVSATSFSPGASRPVLRGFQGERVRVLVDGIGSIDVSNTSADHAVTIDPLIAERIEVLQGPAVLLFGSQAIGGAVNVLDRRIPRVVPDAAHLDVTGTLGSAADEWSIGGAADVPLGGGLVAHVDGSFRKTDDLRTGGFVLAPNLRAEQLAIAEEEFEEGHVEEAEEALSLAGLRGKIPNSATEQKTLGAGIALIRDGGSLGFSVSWLDSDYGVPTRPGAVHHHEEGEEEPEEEHGAEPVTIGLEQFRADLRGHVKVGGFLDEIRVRVGVADYEHTEFEGSEVGTVFSTYGAEGRLEFVQSERGGWRGVTGVQYMLRDFESAGPEAILPNNNTSQLGLFTLQEVRFGKMELEGSLRYERTNVDAKPLGIKRSFNALSAAIGLSYEPAEHARIGINGSRSVRAPSAEEIFSNGPHVATQAFEIGNPDLATEKSWGLEAYAHVERGPVHARISAFANWFKDYIFLTATGEEEDELPVFQYFQRDARYYGFEASVTVKMFEAAGFSFAVDGVADYVRANVKEGGGPVPRIPPFRLLGGLEASSDRFSGRVEVERMADQNRVAEFETPTDGFTMVNASVAWRPWGTRAGDGVHSFGQQHLRRRSPPPRLLHQGLRTPCRTRHSVERPVQLLGGKVLTAAQDVLASAPLPTLSEYAAVAKAKRLDLTDLRSNVLELLWRTNQPLGAYEIAKRLRLGGSRGQATSAYRVLAHLVDAGLVVHIVTLRRFIISPKPGSHNWIAIVCERCKRCVLKPADEIGRRLKDLAHSRGFAATRIWIECVGRCHLCE